MSDYARTALLMMTPSFRRRSRGKQERPSGVSRPRSTTSKKHNNDENNANAAPARSISFHESSTPVVRNESRQIGRGKYGDNHPLKNTDQNQYHAQRNSLSQLTMSQFSQDSHSSNHSLSMYSQSKDQNSSLIFGGTRESPIAIDAGVPNADFGSKACRRKPKVSRRTLSKSISSSMNEDKGNGIIDVNDNIPTKKRSWMETIHDAIKTPHRNKKPPEFRPPAKPQKQKKNQSLHEALTEQGIGTSRQDKESESLHILKASPPHTSNDSQRSNEHKVFLEEQKIAKGLLDEIKNQVIEINANVRADTKRLQNAFEEFKDFVQLEKKKINVLIETSKDLNGTVKKGVEDIVSNAQKIATDIERKKDDNHAQVDAIMTSSNSLKSFIERSFKEFFHNDSFQKRNVINNQKSNDMKGTLTLISNRSPDNSSSLSQGTSIVEQDINKSQNTCLQEKVTQEKNENKRLTRSQKRHLVNKEGFLPKKLKNKSSTDSSNGRLLLTDQSDHRSKEQAQSEKSHTMRNKSRMNVPCEIVTIPLRDESDKTASSDLTESKYPKKSLNQRTSLKRKRGPVSRKHLDSHSSHDIEKRSKRKSVPKKSTSNALEKNIETERKSSSFGTNKKSSLGLNSGSNEGRKLSQNRPHTLLRRRRRSQRNKEHVEDEHSYSKLFASKFTSFFKKSDDSDPFEFK